MNSTSQPDQSPLTEAKVMQGRVRTPLPTTLLVLAFASKACAIFLCVLLLGRVEIGVAQFAQDLGYHLDSPWLDPAPDNPSFLDYFLIILDITTTSALMLMSLLPNRWLVFSPRAFGVSLAVALLPLCLNLLADAMQGHFLEFIVFDMCIFASLPFSLLLSFLRRQEGAKITYV